MAKNKMLNLIALILLVIGGINLGLLGVTQLFGGGFNLIENILGSWPMIVNVVYTLVGVSAILLLMKVLMGMKMK